MTAPKHVVDASLKITEYIDTLPNWSQKICKRLRSIILKTDPKLIEDWKWGPNYYLEGMVCGYAGFQKHVGLSFFRGALLKDKKKLLHANPGSINTRGFKFKDVKEIKEDLILEYVIEAIDLNKKGKKVIVPKDRTVEVAMDIKKEFKLAGVLSYFETLAFSHKKEYIIWIEDAKKEETRKSRIAKAISKLGAKEMMHDKYKK
ncbi:MAG: DUF1801 domain-containing protein [Bacteroidetes bacterium]|nr:DUF1801 domain-containing protein [Bacteroidota bacterium]